MVVELAITSLHPVFSFTILNHNNEYKILSNECNYLFGYDIRFQKFLILDYVSFVSNIKEKKRLLS